MSLRFRFGASYTIGSYLLPGEPIINISEKLNRKIDLAVSTCDKVIEGVKAHKFDLGLIESPLFDDDLVYREFMEDELVICSKTPIKISMDKQDIHRCKLLCRDADSPIRHHVESLLKREGIDYSDFNTLTEIDNTMAAIQGLKWSKVNRENPTVAIVSKLAIEQELETNTLFSSRIHNTPIYRKFYLVYRKKEHEPDHIDDIIHYLRINHL